MTLAGTARAAAAATAFAAFAAAFLHGPEGASGSAEAERLPAPSHRAQPPVTQPALVTPGRDPFAAPPDVPDARAAAAAPREAATVLAALPHVPPALGPLPPNAGAPPEPSATASPQARVAAVVTGAHPVALIVEAAQTRLLAVGDRFGGSAIASIRADGVRLRDGTFMAIAPQAHSASGGW